ncbi:MAG: alpha/beta hydrolase [Deltaproteobacteria bacterium]|nr:alpha/beta hydrolase [Deltaproteobacteria bacterium]
MSLVAQSITRARKRAGGLLLRTFFEGGSRAFRDFPLSRPGTHGLEVIRDVPYTGTGLGAHSYDVWRPKQTAEERAKGPLPLVFYIHGGAFRILSKDSHWIMALAFARRGMCVVLPNYRLAPEHRYPAPIEDCALALRHAVDNAERWGADPKCVVIAGESAGANLAVGLAVGQAWDREEAHLDAIRDVEIKAVAAACGVFQVGDGGRFRRADPSLHWLFDDRFHELSDYLPLRDGKPHDDELASPLLLVERTAPVHKVPPMFLPCGGGDLLKDDHARLERALRGYGVDVDAPVYGKELHAFQAFVWRPEARRFWRDTASFLRSRGVPVREPPPVL